MEDKLRNLLKIINKESCKKNLHKLDNLMLEKIREKGDEQLAEQLSERLKSEINAEEQENKFKLTFRSLTYGLSLTSLVVLIIVGAGAYFYLDTSGLDYDEVETRDKPAYSSNNGYNEQDLMDLMIKNTSKSGYVSLDDIQAEEITQQISDQILNKANDLDLNNDIISKNVFEEEKVLEINFPDGNKSLIVPMDRGFKVLSSTPGNDQIIEFGDNIEPEINIVFTHEDFELQSLLKELEITPNLNGKFTKSGKVVTFKPEDLQNGNVYTLKINRNFSTNSGKKLQEDFFLRVLAEKTVISEQPNEGFVEDNMVDKWTFENNRKRSGDILFYLQGDDIILNSENVDTLEIYRALDLNSDLQVKIIRDGVWSENLQRVEKELIVAKTNLPEKYNFNIVNSDSGDFVEVYLLRLLSGGDLDLVENDGFLVVAVLKDERIMKLSKLDTEGNNLKYNLNYYNWVKDEEIEIKDWSDIKIDLYKKSFVKFELEKGQEKWYYEKIDKVKKMDKVITVDKEKGVLELMSGEIEQGEYDIEINWKNNKNNYISRSWEILVQ